LTRVYFNIVIDKSLVEFAMRTSPHSIAVVVTIEDVGSSRSGCRDAAAICLLVGACCLGHITIVYRLVFRHTKRLRWRSKAYGKCQKVTVEVRSLW